MLFNLIVLALMLMSFAVQEFIPPIMPETTHYARLFLPAVFFFAASVAVPFPWMLILSLVTGVLWDVRYLPMSSDAGQASGAELGMTLADAATMGTADLRFGYSILVFGLLGALMQGVRPLFKKGRLELPVVMVGFSTGAWLLVQYLLMTLLRGSFYFPTAMWLKLVTDMMYAMFFSPLMFLALHVLARVTSYEIKYDGLRYNYDGR